MKRLAPVTLALFLTGCAQLYPAAEQPMAADGVVGEAVTAARASAAGQKTALARAQQMNAQASTPIDRLRLAALLAMLPAPLRDDAKAAELLEPIADAASPGIGRFAALLSLHIAERQRLSRELERADKERDKREEALRRQLEALRSIERGNLEREDRLRGRR